MPRYRGEIEHDVFDDDDCSDCLAVTCRCYQTPDDKDTALQDLAEAMRPTTMALALAGAGVIDCE